MNGSYPRNSVSARIADRLSFIEESCHDTPSGMLRMSLIRSDEDKGEYLFRSYTQYSMRNVVGTLHGGSCAFMVDQAMGCVVNSLFADEAHAPTSQLQLNFHRPMIAGETYMIRVRVMSVSRSLIHLLADVFCENDMSKLCVSSSSIFFRGKQKEGQ
jgi:uncharacterized protein (TIGR00369 family)